MNWKRFFVLSVTASVQLAAVKTTFAQDWTRREVPQEDNQVLEPDGSGWSLSAVACSADGTKLVAISDSQGPILNSTDFGATWQTTPAPRGMWWKSVASSADGTKLVAVTGGTFIATDETIYTSTNSGATWTGHFAASPFTFGWTSVASSADGTNLVVVGSGIYHSGDAGATWQGANTRSVMTNSWSGVASSADGTKLVAVGSSEMAVTQYLYLSSDSGATWVPANVPGVNWWSSVASSADGSKMVATARFPGSLYTSTDSGATWTKQMGAPPEDWDTVASSADGTKLVAGGGSSNGQIYTSSDSGVTWVSENNAPTVPTVPPQNLGWKSVASSADGNKLVARSWLYSGIYTLQFEGPLRVGFDVFPRTNQFFLCDNFQVVATVTNLSKAIVTDVAPVSPPTNGVNGVLRALGQAVPNLPQTIPPNGTVTFTWPFRAGHIGTAILHGQFTGTHQGTPFTVVALAQDTLTVVKPDLVVNRTGDQSAADPSDGCADVDPVTPGRQTTLRAAIETANTIEGRDTILFDLPPQSGGPTISLTQSLPPVTEACDIWGSSQPAGGWVGISGKSFGSGRDNVAALELKGDVIIRGLTFNDFSQGIAVLLSAGANSVQGCRFGIRPDGKPGGDNNVSIAALASNQRIGGSGPGQGNDFRGVSSNPGTGILVARPAGGSSPRQVVIEGNRFGDVDGDGKKTGVANAIQIRDAVSCRIGGFTAGARNYFVGSSRSAVVIMGADSANNEIVGNWFGLKSDGSPVGLENRNVSGVTCLLGAHENRIGGSSASSRNVIACSKVAGVDLSVGAHDNVIEGNWIGLTGDGKISAGNEIGIWVISGANNRVGGSSVGQRNVISGNLRIAILIGRPMGTTWPVPEEDPGMGMCSGTRVEGNWIGLDPLGSSAVPNGRYWNVFNAAVLLSRFATGTMVGGSLPGLGNVISGNEGAGVTLDTAPGTTHTILGNAIGTSGNGLSPLANKGSGIVIIGEHQVTLGGSGAGEGNRIAYNGGPGIDLKRMKNDVPGVALNGNLVYNNHLGGSIVLSPARTPNDGNDPDRGPNGRQNWPLLLSAFNLNGVTEVTADLSSFAPGVDVRIDLFRAAGGGGALLVASTNLVTRSQARDRYLIHAQLQAVGTSLTGLATTTDGTSEFSPPIDVVSGLDSDGDGIPDALERLVPITRPPKGMRTSGGPDRIPSLGDRNADGILDETQASVASARIPDSGEWVTVSAAPGRALTEVVGLRPRDLLSPGGAHEMWPGAVHFTLAGGAGTPEVVQLWFSLESPTPTVWVESDEGWSLLSDATFETRGELRSATFILTARPAGSSWTIALGRPRTVNDAVQLTALPLELRPIGRSPDDPVPGVVSGSLESPPPAQGWVLPLVITLPENSTDWRLETSINLFDWEEVDAWPDIGATELQLAWPIADGSRFFRWRRDH